MKIRIKEAIGKSAPNLWGNGIDYEAGEEVEIRIVNYPGKYHPWLPNNEYADWSLWTSGDTDLAIIFLEKEIDALLLTPKEREQLSVAPFDKASFKLEIVETTAR